METKDIVLHVDGFALQRDHDGAFRVRDIDLAERLGFDRPRNIRQLIGRMVDEGYLPNVSMRATVQRIEKKAGSVVIGVEERTVNEYWLDRIEALLVVMKSETPEANRWCRAIAEAFDRVLQEHKNSQSALRRLPAHLERWFLSPSALDFESLWPDSLVREIERLHGREWTGGRHPHHMKSTYPAIYRYVMSSPVAAKMMASNPEPEKLRHHQFITPEARPYVVAQLGIIEAIARGSASKADFWSRMEREYGGGHLQLAWTA